MTLTRTTAAETASYALSLIGRSRDHLPVPWTASAVMDDCAAFCSHVLWGGKPGPILWVDGFKSAGDGAYAGGSTDLQPWDVLLFDWEGNGVGNHVEFMVADIGNGYVRTYGANGSDTKAAAYRLRPKHYIMGRFRPRWGGTASPAIRITNPTEQDDNEMISKDTQDWLKANILEPVKDAIRRDARGRLYVNTDTGQHVIINWDLPSGDPSKVILIPVGQEGERVPAYYGYELVGDSVAQAAKRNDTQFHSLISLANGTDSAYKGVLA